MDTPQTQDAAALAALRQEFADKEAAYEAVMVEMRLPRREDEAWWDYNAATDRLYAEAMRLHERQWELKAEILRRTTPPKEKAV